MFGGTETVASVIEWAMTELMKCPGEMRKVQEELAQVVGLNRKVHDQNDLDKLPYLKCAIKETLRLHPPIPLLLHEAAEDCKIAGYFIPRGTWVSVNAWAIGRDKTAWEDPETFRPDRFAKQGSADFKGNHFELIPFGSGRRSCPGMQLGPYTVELTMAQLLHCFNWALPNGMKPS
ncbi:cytochrome P450 84A1-like protein [Cinnamomum micranthum f. kanehirae]|uniref:Cytochrome P450 84A1-like protein n=1 Tax=Cinnamomum micranthum f. kanehirae TaxID=337451 RepID=A0A443P586_9MAGN|nr:cytochrome P450 84A1-like protein [Cinnamomum micranthum f. kanehirae]